MSDTNTVQNYYQILEISSEAEHHDIVAAYQRAKIAYAPNSPALYTMFSKEEAEALRGLIEEAFRILSNQAARREYDNLLFNRGQNSSTTITLPDFAPSENKPSNNGKSNHQKEINIQVLREENSNQNLNLNSTLPAGFAKSRLSVYEVNAEIEAEIAARKEYDGPFIKKIRQYKNINLDQLSKETRISRSYLAAIESDDFDALPAPVFLRGFIIQVSRILGLNENTVSASYMARVVK